MRLTEREGIRNRTGLYGKSFSALAVSYLIGAVIGLVFPGRIFAQLPDPTKGWTIYWQYFWYFERFLLPAFLFSFTALGMAAQPVILLLRGFLVSSAAADVVSVLPVVSVPVLVCYGLSGAVSLLMLFLIGSRGLAMAYAAFQVWIGRRRAFLLPDMVLRQIINLAVGTAWILAASSLGFAAVQHFGSLYIQSN